MTAHASLNTAIAALRAGASDYLEKPFALADLTMLVRRLTEHRAARLSDRPNRRPIDVRHDHHPLIGESAAIRMVRDQIARSALTPSNVLITGESGVGKEVVARAVHAASARCDRPFIAINCGAIPETLLESHLFGHVRGAFTTAVHANPGLFVTADTGTLFLDEIGELPLSLQVKLLRVIEDRCVWPVGGTRPVSVDVRIIASTNRDLPIAVAAGHFRSDLFYRLNVVHVKLPPLRERRDDIPLLVEYLVGRLNAKLGTRVVGVERGALWALINQQWNGNVRELENALERAMVLGDGDMILLGDLFPDSAGAASIRPRDLRTAARWFERQHLMDVLAATGADKREAARVLGISLASLYRKLNISADGDQARE
jgi:DNA-binding NtrC family response regulator